MSKTIDLDAAIAAIMSEPSEVRYPAYYAEKLKRIPAVPQEMSAREYIMVYERMLNALKAVQLPVDINERIAFVEQWAKDHPEKKRKTYAEDFKEHFGREWNASRGNWQCRYKLYHNMGCDGGDCFACWNEEMEERDE